MLVFSVVPSFCSSQLLNISPCFWQLFYNLADRVLLSLHAVLSTAALICYDPWATKSIPFAPPWNLSLLPSCRNDVCISFVLPLSCSWLSGKFPPVCFSNLGCTGMCSSLLPQALLHSSTIPSMRASVLEWFVRTIARMAKILCCPGELFFRQITPLGDIGPNPWVFHDTFSLTYSSIRRLFTHITHCTSDYNVWYVSWTLICIIPSTSPT